MVLKGAGFVEVDFVDPASTESDLSLGSAVVDSRGSMSTLKALGAAAGTVGTSCKSAFVTCIPDASTRSVVADR